MNAYKDIYLSKQLREEVRILLHAYINIHYQKSVAFLKEKIDRWKGELSQDGLIQKATNVERSEDKLVKIETKFKEIIVSFNNIPMIREGRWLNLIEECEKATNLPNHYLQLPDIVVKALLTSIQVPNIGLIYRALLDICQPNSVDENVYQTLLTAKDIPNQEFLENFPDIQLIDNFNYIRYPLIASYGLDGEDHEIFLKLRDKK